MYDFGRMGFNNVHCRRHRRRRRRSVASTHGLSAQYSRSSLYGLHPAGFPLVLGVMGAGYFATKENVSI